jgi:hypothetical protein
VNIKAVDNNITLIEPFSIWIIFLVVFKIVMQCYGIKTGIVNCAFQMGALIWLILLDNQPLTIVNSYNPNAD